MESIKILIVDDQIAMRTFIKASLKTSFPSGVEVDEARSGEAARDKLTANPYDIILCDWNMPGMKGTELLDWVKNQDSLKDTQFLMLTAHNEKEIITSAVGMGVSDYLIKPVTVDALSNRVQRALDRVLSARRSKAVGNHPAEGNSST